MTPKKLRAFGRAVQLDPMKPTLKAPGSKRLKLKYGKPLSSFAFNFKLRRYALGRGDAVVGERQEIQGRPHAGRAGGGGPPGGPGARGGAGCTQQQRDSRVN